MIRVDGDAFWGYADIDTTITDIASRYDDIVYACTRLSIGLFVEQIDACAGVGVIPLDDDDSVIAVELDYYHRTINPGPVRAESRDQFVRAIAEYHMCPYIHSFASVYRAIERGSGASVDVRYTVIELAKARRGKPMLFGSADLSRAEIDSFDYMRGVIPPPRLDAVYFDLSDGKKKLNAFGAYYHERIKLVADVKDRRGSFVDIPMQVWQRGTSQSATQADIADYNILVRMRGEFLSDADLRITLRGFFGGTMVEDDKYLQAALNDDEKILRHVACIANYRNVCNP